MEGKKISFSFLKTKNAEKPKVEEPKEYIASFENNSIKVVDVDDTQGKVPIVIPMKQTPEKKITKTEDIIKIKQDDQNNETLEQMAVRELVEEANKEIKVQAKDLSVPTPKKFKAEGAKGSTLDDYEAIPVQEFGMALLRGMGWDPSLKTTKCKMPELRPKGLGLGAGKIYNTNKTENQEELALKSFIKVTSGKHTGFYGKVISINEETGRVVVELAMNSEKVSLSEFMLKAVTEYEYNIDSKNNNKATDTCNEICPKVTNELISTPGNSRDIKESKKD